MFKVGEEGMRYSIHSPVHTVSNPCMSNSVNFTWEGYIECWGRPGHKLVDVQQYDSGMYMYHTRKDLFTVGSCNSIHVSVIQSLVAWCPGTKKAVRG